MQFQCPKCKAVLASDGVTEGMMVTCPECGASIECHAYLRKVRLRKVENSGTATENHEGQSGSIHSKVTSESNICNRH